MGDLIGGSNSTIADLQQCPGVIKVCFARQKRLQRTGIVTVTYFRGI